MTQHPPHTTPPPPAESEDQATLHDRVRELEASIHRRLRKLADQAGPPVTAELEAVHSGLDPEQTIRAFAALVTDWPFATLEAAEAYIRDGSRS